jgi:hypothetical protein
MAQCAIKSAMASLTEEYLFVAAIDFGTTYSGYSFSSRDDFKKDPQKLVANQAWNAGSQRHFSLKTPTCLLLDDKEELISFGYEAENKYSNIVIDLKQNEYLFFQRFKMQLYKNKVNNLCNLIKIASLICSKERRRSEKIYIYLRVICQ